MKLTKGKISKLYNKKKQSLKRIKGKKISNKRRTFRNKKTTNLARKTLKRLNKKKYIGGFEENIPKDEIQTPIEENVVSSGENILPKEDNQIQTEELTPISNLNDTTDINDTNDNNILPESNNNLLQSELTEAYNDNLQNYEQNNESDENSNLNMADELKLETTEEMPKEDMPTEDIPVEEIPTDKEDIPNDKKDISTSPTNEESEPDIEIPSEDITENKDVSTINSEPNKEKLIQSLNQFVDYMTDAVAEKVSENIALNQNSGDYPQNGFDAVNKTAEMMATTGGSKFKRTRHFRLTNKNKSKRS